ncbi:MAG: hypothetical protein GY898_10025 [Proteobacteria bacterium]|nr:hypothetical protein [Pseudomonadota bacterium]
MTRLALCLFAALLVAGCAADPRTSDPSGPAPDGLADPDLIEGTPEEIAFDSTGSDDDDATPEEDPTPSEEEIGMSPGDSAPGVPGVMTGLRARVAWNDGYVHTPAQEIQLNAPNLGMPLEMPDELPAFGELTPQQVERMGEVEAIMKSRLGAAQLQLNGQIR